MWNKSTKNGKTVDQQDLRKKILKQEEWKQLPSTFTAAATLVNVLHQVLHIEKS